MEIERGESWVVFLDFACLFRVFSAYFSGRLVFGVLPQGRVEQVGQGVIS
jgi:hypothetical protein